GHRSTAPHDAPDGPRDGGDDHEGDHGHDDPVPGAVTTSARVAASARAAGATSAVLSEESPQGEHHAGHLPLRSCPASSRLPCPGRKITPARTTRCPPERRRSPLTGGRARPLASPRGRSSDAGTHV